MYNKLLVIPKVGGANIDKALSFIEELSECIHEFYEGDLKLIYNFDEADENTLVVPVGGDGTVLYAAKAMLAAGKDLPIMGFNLGNVGFLTDLSNQDGFANGVFLSSVLNDGDRADLGPLKEDIRTLLICKYQDKEFVALNDIVISNLYSDNIIKYGMTIGESDAGEHRANGVIIATPTGSTAYSMNCGGAIIEPDLDVLQVVQIAGMGLTARPIISSGKNEIGIYLDPVPGRMVSIKADGRECLRVDGDAIEITITRYKNKIRLLHFDHWNFFEKLSEKLGWNHV